MIVVEESSFVYGDKFLPEFQILIFYCYETLKIKSEDQLA